MRYELRVVRVPPASLDEVVATLRARGALGFEIADAPADLDDLGRLRLDAWFEEGADERPAGDLGGVEEGVEEVERRLVDAEDWLAPYRARSKPLEIGGGFVVDPRLPEEHDPDDPGDRPEVDPDRLLSIPAQNAFGTGSHETTRLVAARLADLAARGLLVGRRVLDVGTGSGILAFVAERLGAARVVGIDLDPTSVVVARANARRNGCAPSFAAARLDALSAARAGARFDLALVNVLPERILADYPRLLDLLEPDALIVSSGNLVTQRAGLLRRFDALGLRPVEESIEGEWIAWLLERSSP